MPLQIPLLQSSMVVAIDTDIGITGIGEGGTLDTIAPCAARLIGQNPFEITRIWQDMYRAYHYPPGRERLHAMGAMDLALWDLKGKALNAPVYELLGGLTREYLECYTTGFRGGGPTIQERAATCMAAGWRYFRMDAASLAGGNTTYDARERVDQVLADCRAMREGGGRRQLCDRLSSEVQLHRRPSLLPHDRGDPPVPRRRSGGNRPLPAGYPEAARDDQRPPGRRGKRGARYDYVKLVTNRDLDYIRVSLPNTGGITEMVRIASMCETHEVGIVPHFTGPISTAAQVHTLGAFPIPVVMAFNSPTATSLTWASSSPSSRERCTPTTGQASV